MFLIKLLTIANFLNEVIGHNYFASYLADVAAANHSNHVGCDFTTDIFDTSGVYLKSVCQSSQFSMYDEACVELGMKLFIIASPDVTTQILSFATYIYGASGGARLWVNGKEDENGKWFTFDGISKQPLMSGFISLRDLKPKKRKHKHIDEDERHCLTVSSYWQFEVNYDLCDDMLYSFCEYKEPSLTTSASIAHDDSLPLTTEEAEFDDYQENQEFREYSRRKKFGTR